MIPEKIKPPRSSKGSWKSVLGYALRDNKEGTKQPKIIASNMFERTHEGLAEEFSEVRPKSGRVDDPIWHVALSAAPGEHFSDEQWAEFGQLLIDKVGAKARATKKGKKELGISTQDNQFVIVRHQDEQHEHIHIILNRVRWDGQTCYLSWDKRNLHAAAAEIEQEFSLVRVDHGRELREGKQKKDSRQLSPRQVARLEKKADKTGEVDPKLVAHYEWQREQEEQRQKAEAIAPIAIDYFHYLKAQGKAQELEGREQVTGKNYWLQYQPELEQISLFSHSRGNLLRAFLNGHLEIKSAQNLDLEDLENFQDIRDFLSRQQKELQQQSELHKKQQQEQLKQQSTLRQKDTGYER